MRSSGYDHLNWIASEASGEVGRSQFYTAIGLLSLLVWPRDSYFLHCDNEFTFL
jgi:hypothetical protein